VLAKHCSLLLATAALWVQIRISLKNTKWATKAKELPAKKIYKKIVDDFNIKTKKFMMLT
jgi:hypothetical protein